jgi:hypothetical protein
VNAKAKFDALDADIARAARLGRTGELRRLYTQGIALAQNRRGMPTSNLPHRWH